MKTEVADLLLLSKSLIDKIRIQLAGNLDRHSLAVQILTAHDSAELALSAIANHTGKLPKEQRYLMNYFEPLKSLHPEEDVPGKEYFNQVNRVRNNIKHHGIFPDATQWSNVGEKVYEYIHTWCQKYLELSLEDLDQSVLLESKEVKKYYDEAKEAMTKGDYKGVMEKLALALDNLFDNSAALRGFLVGIHSAEQAIKLAAFGVQTNDFLTLQQFLPTVEKKAVQWKQNEYGHPGNWREDAALFCLRTFVDVALKIQSAPWTPSPIYFAVLYRYKIEVLTDNVEVWNSPESKPREVIQRLSRGQTFLGYVEASEKASLGLALELVPKTKPELVIMCKEPYEVVGYIAKENVRITCVPHDHRYVKTFFPGLSEIPWKE